MCLLGLALLSPLTAQSPVDQQVAEGTANIYNLYRDARVGGVEIHGSIGKAVASQAVKLIRSIRPDVDALTVFLSSPGGNVLAAIELGEEVRKQWAWTAVDDNEECFGAFVLALAGGVRRTAAPENVGLQRMNFDQKEFASMSRDRVKQKYTALAKRVQTYLLGSDGNAKKALPRDDRPADKVRLLDAGRLKTLELDGHRPGL